MWTAAMHVFQHSPPLLCKSGQSYLRRIFSIQQERKDSFCVLSFFLLPPAVGSLKHEPCASRYMACVHSGCAMKFVHLELLVWTQTRGEKLCFVAVSFSTRKYPALIVSRSNMDDRDLETEVSLWSLQVCIVPC